jgi:cytochrome c oxidase subunit IV
MSAHIVSTKIYYAVFATLMVLTALTVAVATVDLGRLNIVIALTIAVCKASLVLLFFMHLRYSVRLTWVVVGAAVVWLMILIGFTMTDVLTRGWLAAGGVAG